MRNNRAYLFIFLSTLCWFGPGVKIFSQTPDWAWAKGFGALGYDEGRSIAVDDSGYAYTAGRFQDTIDFDPGPGIYELGTDSAGCAFVSKLDSAGNFVWAIQLGILANTIAVDGLGNCYVAGAFSDTVDFDPGPGTFNLVATGIFDMCIVKLNSSGDFIWAKKMGGSGFRSITSLALDRMDSLDIYVTGYFDGTTDFDPGPGTYYLSAWGHGIFVSKLDSSGNLVWAKGVDDIGNDNGGILVLDDSANVYVTGSFMSSSDFDPGPGNFYMNSTGGADIFILKLDSAGSFAWSKRIGGANWDYPMAMAFDSTGSLYTTGYFNGTVDFDPGPGVFNLNSSSNGNVIFISKLSRSGNFTWAKDMSGAGSATGQGTSIALDKSGNVYTAGEYWGTIDFDPGIGVYNLTSVGEWDIFISKLDSLGNFLWTKSTGSTFPDYATSMALDSFGNMFLTGSYASNSIAFGTTVLTNPYGPATADIFVGRLDAAVPTNIHDVDQLNDIRIYPNPAREEFVAQSKRYKIERIEIHDLLGMNTREASMKGAASEEKINLSGLPPGLYVVKIITAHGAFNTKLIKE